jgi:hypothetical protein
MAEMLDPAASLFGAFAPTLIETMSRAAHQIYADDAGEVRVALSLVYSPPDDEPAFEFELQDCDLEAGARLGGYEVLSACYRLSEDEHSLRVETSSAEPLEAGGYLEAPAHEAAWLNALGPRTDQIAAFLAAFAEPS